MRKVLPTTSYQEHDLFEQRVTDSVGSGRFNHLQREEWDVADADSDIPDAIPEGYKGSRFGGESVVLYYDEENYTSTIRISIRSNKIYVYVASNDLDFLENYADSIKKNFKPVDITREGVVPIKFWSLSSRGPQDTNRDIETPNWESIKDNYCQRATEKLSHLMNDFEPGLGGKLFLWHGRPGTGKTYALRSLVHQWRTWCTAEYIVDPERFFQSEASYMMEVLLRTNRPSYLMDDDEEEDQDKEKWRLLIFEDTGELLSADAKERAGQGLSRLLNVVDGLIGQGLKVIILITTNEDIDSLHEAVSRPGRTAIKIPFEALSAAESVSWASRHGFEVDGVSEEYTLAELYAKIGHFEEGGDPKPHRKIGFQIT